MAPFMQFFVMVQVVFTAKVILKRQASTLTFRASLMKSGRKVSDMKDNLDTHKLIKYALEMKKAEERGLLLKLPCKVRDAVYYESQYATVHKGVQTYQITNIMISQNKKGEWTKKYRAMMLLNGRIVDSQLNFSFDDLGKTVFLTKEEAEQALAERNEIGQTLCNCKEKVIIPPHNFIKYNGLDEYMKTVAVDECLADEIESLWAQGIKTCGCCCGHGKEIGFIQVRDECIPKMRELGYEKYIYPDEHGGVGREDAFIPKTVVHIFKN